VFNGEPKQERTIAPSAPATTPHSPHPFRA
jgi:hypothetical protein